MQQEELDKYFDVIAKLNSRYSSVLYLHLKMFLIIFVTSENKFRFQIEKNVTSENKFIF